MKTAIRDQKSIWKEFGPWLRRQREISGKARKWVAAEIGIHPVQLARIESGESGTRKDTLDALIACLGLNAEEAYVRAGLWPKTIEEIEEEKRARETVEEALHNSSFFNRKGLSPSNITELRPYFQMLDREVERVQEQELRKIRFESQDDIQRLADELAEGGPLVKKLKKDELVTNSDIAHKPKKGKKS